MICNKDLETNFRDLQFLLELNLNNKIDRILQNEGRSTDVAIA